MSQESRTRSNITRQIAAEINCNPQQVETTISLIEEGCTIPFIARYRKEKTGGLDDEQLRTLETRLEYLNQFEARRLSIIKSIEDQGKLEPSLLKAIESAVNKTQLEDLYLPYKTKRRTKGQIAIEAGLGDLAKKLLLNPSQDPEQLAAGFINTEAGFIDSESVLEGAKSILVEQFATDASLLSQLRNLLQQQGLVSSKVVSTKIDEAQKFRDYFDYQEPLKKVPSHRALALLRGRQAGFLRLKIDIEPSQAEHPAIGIIARQHHVAMLNLGKPSWLAGVVQACWQSKLSASLETELLSQLRQRAEQDAIEVFAKNLKDLLLAAPAGTKTTLALDPGLRTGVKVAVIDATGKVLDTDTIYPHQPRNQWSQSIARLEQLILKHHVELVSVGNGTASRETEKLINDVQRKLPANSIQSIMVSEAGASVYSASKLASLEFPDMDVSLRGAVSIGRRLQDPLAELVKIDPKAIGVGQYQHDVNQSDLSKQLDAVVEDCVNAVGVELNSASAPLLSRVSGLSQTLASNIVEYRDQNGAFSTRSELKKVARLGPKAFEQAAGFLRIRGAKNLLDNSGVHPEAYALAKSMLADSNIKLEDLSTQAHQLSQLNFTQYVSDTFGLPTIKDIVAELEKPGRDPRPEFKTAQFKEGIETIKDLKTGLRLEGVVTNVTNFGAFVDIGVHQDGLVHISMLADSFVKDPHTIVKAGDIVKVSVLEVDVQRKRIALSMRSESTETSTAQSTKSESHKPQARNSQASKTDSRSASVKPVKHQGNNRVQTERSQTNRSQTNSAFADAFAKAKKN